MALLRVLILIWADLLATYVMWIMQKYLTDVWKLGFTHAAGIMNVASGLAKVLPLVFYYFVDTGLGNYWMLFISSFSYTVGLGLLSMSTPPVLAKATGTCKRYEPQCIGHTQKALFYTSLALIAVGISGHIVSLVALFVDQFEKKREMKPYENNDYKPECQRNKMLTEEWPKKKGGAQSDSPNYPNPPPPPAAINQNRSKPDDSAEVDLLSLQFQPVDAMLALVKKEKKKVTRACLLVLVPVIATFVLPYIKPWSLRFGIPSICSCLAYLCFLLGSGEYKENKSEGSPVTNVFRVILAATLKMFKRLPSSSEPYENDRSDVQKLPHTRGLRFLDKAAIKEGPESRRWLLCTVTEVEQTKIVIHMIPIWITLIICGVVTSVGSTYFVEQTKHMNYKLKKWKLPDSLLLILYTSGKSVSKLTYDNCFGKRYPPQIGIAIATVSSALCCIVAALVETQRIHVIRGHDLINKPDEDVPMTVFWLLPQYLLLAGLDSFYENSVTPFLSDQSPLSMQKYLVFLNPGLSGLGIIGSVLSVYVVGRVSERHGKPNWFQHNLNGSRLDCYYWTLAVLSAANFIWFVVCTILCPYRVPQSNADGETGNQEEMRNVERTGELTDNIIQENQKHLSLPD